jgi:hypothetical protein
MKKRWRFVWSWQYNIADAVAKDMNEKISDEHNTHSHRQYIVERATLWGRVPFGYDVVKYLDP